MEGRNRDMGNPGNAKKTQQVACRIIQRAFTLVLGGCSKGFRGLRLQVNEGRHGEHRDPATCLGKVVYLFI